MQQFHKAVVMLALKSKEARKISQDRMTDTSGFTDFEKLPRGKVIRNVALKVSK